MIYYYRGKSKYNCGAVIELDTIPDEELERALKEFAEGSLGLEACLRTMWQMGLKTIACCSGNKSDYVNSYISMREGVDVFSYLSDTTLNNPCIWVEISYDKQVIRFTGSISKREELMQMVANDIAQGKKEKSALLDTLLDPNSVMAKSKKRKFILARGVLTDELGNLLDVDQALEKWQEIAQNGPKDIEYVAKKELVEIMNMKDEELIFSQECAPTNKR